MFKKGLDKLLQIYLKNLINKPKVIILKIHQVLNKEEINTILDFQNIEIKMIIYIYLIMK